MTLANPLRKVASKLMAKFGGVVTINRVTAGVYNPTTGTASEVVAGTVVRGVMEDVNVREVNDLIQSGDKRLTIAAADLADTTIHCRSRDGRHRDASNHPRYHHRAGQYAYHP
jgi:hypothetical protein